MKAPKYDLQVIDRIGQMEGQLRTQLAGYSTQHQSKDVHSLYQCYQGLEEKEGGLDSYNYRLDRQKQGVANQQYSHSDFSSQDQFYKDSLLI